jgi:hypothetical protein
MEADRVLPPFRFNEALLDGYFAIQIYLGLINFKKYEHYWERLNKVDMTQYDF